MKRRCSPDAWDGKLGLTYRADTAVRAIVRPPDHLLWRHALGVAGLTLWTLDAEATAGSEDLPPSRGLRSGTSDGDGAPRRRYPCTSSDRIPSTIDAAIPPIPSSIAGIRRLNSRLRVRTLTAIGVSPSWVTTALS